MLKYILNNNLLQTGEVANVGYQLAEQPDGDSDYMALTTIALMRSKKYSIDFPDWTKMTLLKT